MRVRHLLEEHMSLEPYSEELDTPIGYALTPVRVHVPRMKSSFSSGEAPVPAHSICTITVREKVSLRNISATVHLSPALQRRGLMMTPLRLHGSEEIVLTVYNATESTKNLPVREGIAYLVPDPFTVKASAPPDGGWICRENSCSLCCFDTEMPLTVEDMERLDASGYSDYWVERDGFAVLRNIDGRCFFLKDGRCSIYSQRPEGCRYYPAVYSMEKERAELDDECPYRMNFCISQETQEGLRKLVERLHGERERRLLEKQ